MISPNTFGYITVSSMYLSSLNRSICQCFRHIIPCSAPLCAIVHSFPTDLPWQMKSTFIIVLFLLVLPRNALFCEGFRVSCSLLWNYRKSGQNPASCYYLLVVKLIVKWKGLLLRILFVILTAPLCIPIIQFSMSII